MWASLPLASSPEHCLPHIQFLFIGSRLCSPLLSGPASRRVLFHPCASLSLHVHHVVKRICTSQLSIMLGTRKRDGRALEHLPSRGNPTCCLLLLCWKPSLMKLGSLLF